jgi:hypothetical protein
MAAIAPPIRQQFFDSAGKPLAGGKLRSMAAGTEVNLPTFQDEAGTVPHTNPIILNSRGEVTYYLSDAPYKFRLLTPTDVEIYTVDNVTSPTAAASALRADLASTASASVGAGLVGYNSTLSYPANTVGGALGFTQAGAGAVLRTIQNKARERVSIFDFLTLAQVEDVQARTFVTPAAIITAAFNAAAAYAMSTSGRLYLPAGAYRLNTVSLSNVRGLIIEGAGSSLLAGGVTYGDTTVLSFDGAASGTNGLVVDNFFGLVLRNFNITMRRTPVGGGGVGLKLTTGHDFEIDNVKIDINVGGGGFAFQFGGGSGGTAAFMGSIKNCKAFGNTGAGFYLNFTTSLTFTTCYAIGGSFQIAGSAYCSFISCASEVSPAGRYGYEVTGSSNLSFVSCGTESNNKGGFYLTGGSFNLNFLNPYGANNNLKIHSKLAQKVV